MSEDFLLGRTHLIRSRFELRPGKVQIVGSIDRNEMEMGMGNLEADDRDPAAVAWECLFDRQGDWFGKEHKARQVIVPEIEEAIDLQLGYDQRMTFAEGENIQKGKEPVTFRDLVRSDVSGNYLGEDRHTVMFSILNCSVPAGTCTCATSPTCFPSRPLPMGEVTEILPCFRSASFSDTR